MQIQSNEDKVLETMSTNHIRIAVVGNVDAGKSTLIGTLATSDLDDGRGTNRSKITKLKHELETGRTSSISNHLMGFDADGKPIIPRNHLDLNEIATKASRVVSLIDLAGHEKYLKTTVEGISSGMADYALVLVNAAQPPTHMTIKHLNLCLMSGIPVIVVITKIDACPAHVLRTTKASLKEVLRNPRIGLHGYAVKTGADVETVKDKLSSLAPVVETSCVTGEGLEVLGKLLSSLPKRRQHEKKIDRPFEFLIENTFDVPGVGLVFFGFVNTGQWKKGEPIYIGPLSDGSFVKITVKSAQVSQTNVTRVWAGHSACFAVSLNKDQKKAFRKRRGMVALKTAPSSTSKRFTADIVLVKGESCTMVVNTYCTTAHILHMKRQVRLVKADAVSGDSGDRNSTLVLRPGQKARVTFVLSQPAYIRKGMRLILRDGHIRGAGIIVSTDS